MGDGAVGPVVEPLGVLVHPGVVGGALEGEVEGDLQAQRAGLADEVVEVLDGAELGVDGVVSALGGADGPGHADVVGGGGEAVVAALAEGVADRVDRGR